MPATRDKAIDEVVSRMIAPLGAVPTKWPNGPEPVRVDNELWCRVTFRHADSNRKTIGVRREQHDAHVYVQYCFPLGSGATLLYTVPQAMLDALTDYKSPSGVWFRKVELLEGSADDLDAVDGYYVMTLRARFTYDEIRTN